MTTPDAGTPHRPGLLTVGHSNHDLDTFFSLPAMDRVQLIVDVRSSPWSRFAPHFNRNSLQTSIRQRGLEYLHAGDRLGGRPSDPTLYTTDGQADYQAMAQDPGFQGALAALTELATEGQTAILCSERDPQKCHRALLIADALDSQGVAVAHILPGSPEPLPHAQLLASLMESWHVQDPCVSSKLKMGESSKMELTHPVMVASSAGTLRRCVKHIAEGGKSERDLRDERGGPFDPGDCPGVGRVPQHGPPVPEVA